MKPWDDSRINRAWRGGYQSGGRPAREMPPPSTGVKPWAPYRSPRRDQPGQRRGMQPAGDPRFTLAYHPAVRAGQAYWSAETDAIAATGQTAEEAMAALIGMLVDVLAENA
jgi:hypothetical protein